jgi:hypothetical protein
MRWYVYRTLHVLDCGYKVHKKCAHDAPATCGLTVESLVRLHQLALHEPPLHSAGPLSAGPLSAGAPLSNSSNPSLSPSPSIQSP